MLGLIVRCIAAVLRMFSSHLFVELEYQDEIDSAKWNLVERKKINENGRKRAIEKVYWIQQADFDLKAFSVVIDVIWGLT